MKKGIALAIPFSFVIHANYIIMPRIKQYAKPVKGRNYAVIIYPDINSADWVDRIKKIGVKTFISPCHDKDKFKNDDPKRNIKAGQLKKAHYHVILCFNGPVTKEFVSKQLLNQKIKLGPEPMKINNLSGQVRYLIHKDDPDKYQYPRRDIRTFNGAEYEQYFRLNRAEMDRVVNEITGFILDKEIDNFADLVVAGVSHEDWSIAIRKNSYYFRSLIDGQWHRLRRPK